MRTRTLNIALIFAVLVLLGPIGIYGQNASPSQAASNAKPRVFVDSVAGAPAANASDGPQLRNADIVHLFEQKCPLAQADADQADADYLMELVASGASHHKGRVVVIDRRSGDPVGGKSAATMDSLLEDACGILTMQWGIHSSELLGMREIENALAPQSGAAPQSAVNNSANISITSNPSGADIQIDGNYVGSTPSEVKLPQGTVLIKIQKKGFNAWERKLKISGIEVKVNADLDASAASN